MVKARRLARHRAEQGRGRPEPVDALEERRNAGERDDQLRDVARSLERGDGFEEQHERRLGFAVGRVEPGRVSREESFEELHAVFPHEGHALVPRGQGAPWVDLREGLARDPQRVRDPIGIAELARRGDRVLGQRDGLVDSTARLKTVDI